MNELEESKPQSSKPEPEPISHKGWRSICQNGKRFGESLGFWKLLKDMDFVNKSVPWMFWSLFLPILQHVLIYFRCISHPSNSWEASVWTNMAQNWRCLCDNVWKLCRAMSCNGMKYFRYKSCTSFDGKMDMPRHNESRWSMLFKVDERFGQRKEKTFVIFWNETLMRWQRKSVLECFGAIRYIGLPAL